MLVSHKMVFIENEAALLCVTMQERACIYNCNLACNFLILLLPLAKKFNFCGALFKCILAWERDIVLRMKLFFSLHLAYSWYRGVKICFHLCRYENEKFSLMLYLRDKCLTSVALVLLGSCTCVIKWIRSCDLSTLIFLWFI